jgi:hypothetical protein
MDSAPARERTIIPRTKEPSFGTCGMAHASDGTLLMLVDDNYGTADLYCMDMDASTDTADTDRAAQTVLAEAEAVRFAQPVRLERPVQHRAQFQPSAFSIFGVIYNQPRQLAVAPDGLIFVVRFYEVFVLTPQFNAHSRFGIEDLDDARGVCVNDDFVAVGNEGHVCLFGRQRYGDGDGDGDTETVTHIYPLLHRIGEGVLEHVVWLGFVNVDVDFDADTGAAVVQTLLVVADSGRRRISMFTLAGELVRHVGEGALQRPISFACVARGELVVVDDCGTVAAPRTTYTRQPHYRIVAIDAAGVARVLMENTTYNSVTLHNGTVYAYDGGGELKQG